MGIRNRWCHICGIHTPTMTHKSMVGEVTKCLRCQHERIIHDCETETNDTEVVCDGQDLS